MTELCPLGELYTVVSERGPLSDDQACSVMRKLMSAISALHSRGVVHRDISPTNILCGCDVTDVRLADFGVSTLLRSGSGSCGGFASQSQSMAAASSVAGSMCGTPHYAAPEVLGADHHDKKVDIWSAGVVAYVVLTGCLPFHSDDIRVLVAKIVRGRYAWPSDVDVSGLAKDFVTRMLVTDPVARPSAEECLQHPWIMKAAPIRICLGARKSKTPGPP